MDNWKPLLTYPMREKYSHKEKRVLLKCLNGYVTIGYTLNTAEVSPLDAVWRSCSGGELHDDNMPIQWQEIPR